MLAIKNILKTKTTRSLHIRSIAGILSLAMSLSLAPMQVLADSSFSSSAGTSSNAGGGNKGSNNYCSSPAYALYLADDDWYSNAVLPSGTDDQSSVATALRSAVETTFKYKYQSWGSNYVYLVPTFEPTSGGTGHASEMQAVNKIAEVNSSYSGWSIKQDTDRIVKLESKVDLANSAVADYLTLGRYGAYKQLKAKKGKVTFDDLTRQIDKGTAKTILSYIVSGGPNEVAARAGRVAYTDSEISWASGKEQQTPENRVYLQEAGYLALLVACYQYTGSNQGEWKTKIMNAVNSVADGSGDVKGFPVLVIDRALGVSVNSGAMNTVMDGIDLYSYATGMKSGKWNNLRDGYEGAVGFKAMASKILGWLDFSGQRAIPVQAQ